MSKSKNSKYRFYEDEDEDAPVKDFNWLNAKKIRREKQNRLRQVEEKKD